MRRDQFKKRGRYSSLLWPALVVLLSACETGYMSTAGMSAASVAPIEPTQLMFSNDASIGPWDGASSVLDDKVRLRGRLKPHADNPGLKLGPLLADVRQKNAITAGGTPPFRGLGGGYYKSLLKAADGKVGSDSAYDAFKTATVELSGRITDYEFQRTASDKGSGKLTVETTQRVKHAGTLIEVRNFKWVIDIKQRGYHIHTHSNDDNDPFPDTLYFDSHMVKRIKEKGYNVKLQATGNSGFSVEEVWVGDASGGDPVILNAAHPEWQEFKTLKNSSQNDCIDMFLKVDLDANGDPNLDQIPQDYDTLINDFYYSYCLGRCKNPAIINSR